MKLSQYFGRKPQRQDYIVVELTPEQIMQAEQTGDARQRESVASQRVRRAHQPANEAPAANRIGCIGEVALAAWAGVAWDTRVNIFTSKPDVYLWDVRATKWPDGKLIVQPHDKDERLFVLAVVDDLPRVKLMGWMTGRQAKQPGWLWAPRKEYGRPEESHYVPQQALFPMSTLPGR